MTKVWAIYNSPAGAPAPFYVMCWEGSPGVKATHGAPVFASSLERARAIPPGGLIRHDPSTARAEDPDMLETWESA